MRSGTPKKIQKLTLSDHFKTLVRRGAAPSWFLRVVLPLFVSVTFVIANKRLKMVHKNHYQIDEKALKDKPRNENVRS